MIVNILKTTAGGNWMDVFIAPVASQMVTLLPVALPVLVLILAVRKGINFLCGLLRGA